VPSICGDRDRRLNTGGRVRRDDRWRCIQRDTRGGRPLGIFMIKTQSMIMVPRRVDS